MPSNWLCNVTIGTVLQNLAQFLPGSRFQRDQDVSYNQRLSLLPLCLYFVVVLIRNQFVLVWQEFEQRCRWMN